MSLRKRSDKKAVKPDEKTSEKLANELANKVYGSAPNANKKDESKENDPLVRTSIMIHKSTLRELERLTYDNKINDKPLKNVSELIRESVSYYLLHNK